MSHKWVIKGSHVRWRGLPVRGRPRRAACSLGTGADASSGTAEAARAARYADPAPALRHGAGPRWPAGPTAPARPQGRGRRARGRRAPVGGALSAGPDPGGEAARGGSPESRGAGKGGWEDPQAASAPRSPRGRRGSPGPGPGRAQLVGWPSVCETHLRDQSRTKGTAFKTHVLFLFF